MPALKRARVDGPDEEEESYSLSMVFNLLDSDYRTFDRRTDYPLLNQVMHVLPTSPKKAVDSYLLSKVTFLHENGTQMSLNDRDDLLSLLAKVMAWYAHYCDKLNPKPKAPLSGEGSAQEVPRAFS